MCVCTAKTAEDPNGAEERNVAARRVPDVDAPPWFWPAERYPGALGVVVVEEHLD